ncbi:DUF4176 domain-containing protein [Tractidigestivibacter sp.]|uniref:DUF4176 domain-containing protein n=1 Tax=Tractidigestivibacter sp. TaxID=2847320 RepID=UPI002A90B804|nr:DUF4176 domain-containing protein [Tractidigestivibacter sp.]MDY5271305.1 DUF4176 domain-containing protein [Tractidigestivibacter sp.]
MYENLLPLGSVILLKDGNKRLMVTGRIQARAGDSRIYDYSGCLFPEGLTSPDGLYFFNHDAIDTVFFIGFQDEEELLFKRKLGELGELYVDEDGHIAAR